MTPFEILKAESELCIACRLAEGRTRVVFGEGDPHSRLVLVGEAPGRDEDLTGRPFIGRAGELLTRILASVGFDRKDVFITNTVMCRPPNNRPPAPDEVAACHPFLKGKLDLIGPQMVVALGAAALKTLTGDIRASITQRRGQRLIVDGRYLYPTFHPAALLRDPAKKRPVWEDFKRIRADYDRLAAGETLDGGG